MLNSWKAFTHASVNFRNNTRNTQKTRTFQRFNDNNNICPIYPSIIFYVLFHFIVALPVAVGYARFVLRTVGGARRDAVI